MGEQVGAGSMNMDAALEQIEALRSEHAALKRRLADFQRLRFLTPTEELELRRLRKLKLLAKDRIVRLEHALR